VHLSFVLDGSGSNESTAHLPSFGVVRAAADAVEERWQRACGGAAARGGGALAADAWAGGSAVEERGPAALWRRDRRETRGSLGL
jgi:hypothetical protein